MGLTERGISALVVIRMVVRIVLRPHSFVRIAIRRKTDAVAEPGIWEVSMSKPTRAELIADAEEWKRSYHKLQTYLLPLLKKEDEFWAELDRRFCTQDKAWMEDYAERIYGDKKYSMAATIHFMWKRDPHVKEIEEALAAAEVKMGEVTAWAEEWADGKRMNVDKSGTTALWNIISQKEEA